MFTVVRKFIKVYAFELVRTLMRKDLKSYSMLTQTEFGGSFFKINQSDY